MIILKKINLRALIADAIGKAKSIDLDKLEERFKRSVTGLPGISTRYLLDNNVFIASVIRGWTKSIELIYYLLDSPAEVVANEPLIFEDKRYDSI